MNIDERILNIDGWMSLCELNWLFETTLGIPDGGLIVEIGAWKGRSTAALYNAAGNSKSAITIDTWLGEPELRTTVYREAMYNDVFLIFLDNMKSLGIAPIWYKENCLGAQYLRMNSMDAAAMFDNESVDMFFHDGDHLSVGKELDVWYDKVRTGGIICGHDWTWACVQDAVNKRFTVDKIIDTIWIKKKISEYPN